MLAGASKGGTCCAEADGRVLGCKCSEIRLKVRGSCSIVMGESPGDRGEARKTDGR